MHHLASQPQDIVKIWLSIFRLTYASMSKAGVISFVYGVLLIVSALAIYLSFGDANQMPRAVIFIFMLSVAISYPIVLGATLILVNSSATNVSVSLFESIKFGFRYFVSSLFAAVLYLFVVAVGLLLFVIPGIYLMILFGMWWVGIFLKKESALTALLHSKALVGVAWWRTALVFCSVLGFIVSIDLGFELAFVFFENLIPEFWGYIFGLTFTSLQIAFTSVLFCASLVVQMNDLQLRRNATK